MTVSLPVLPCPSPRPLKPDLIPLHAGNLLVYWAFLGGKLHCLYSWALAPGVPQGIPKTPFSWLILHTPSGPQQNKFYWYALSCKQGGNKQAIIPKDWA